MLNTLKHVMTEVSALVSLMLFGSCLLIWAAIIAEWARP